MATGPSETCNDARSFLEIRLLFTPCCTKFENQLHQTSVVLKITDTRCNMS